MCEAERRLALGLGAGSRARLVHNGIDAPAETPVHPRVAALRERGPVIATLTLLRPGKGVETLLDALPALLAAHPDAQLVIAGAGVDRERLEERARGLGVAAAVHFLGFVPDSGAVLRGADVFVLSSWAESFPYVILDAMALGRPIVATDVGGVAEAVGDGDGDCGLLVASRDADGLARALRRLISDPAGADEMGARARSRVTGALHARADARGPRRRLRRHPRLTSVYRSLAMDTRVPPETPPSRPLRRSGGEDSVEARRYLDALRRRLWLIVLLGLTAAATAVAISSWTPDRYKATREHRQAGHDRPVRVGQRGRADARALDDRAAAPHV